MPHVAEPVVSMHVLDVLAARKLWHQRTLGVFRLVAQPSVQSLAVLLDTPTRTLHVQHNELILYTPDGDVASVELQQAGVATADSWMLHNGLWPLSLCAALQERNAPAFLLIPIASVHTKEQKRLVQDAAGIHIATITLSHGYISGPLPGAERSELTISCTHAAPAGTAAALCDLIEARVACTTASQSIRAALHLQGAATSTAQTPQATLAAQVTALSAMGRDPDEAVLVPLPRDDNALHRIVVAATLVQQSGHPAAADPFWMVLDPEQRESVTEMLTSPQRETTALPSAPFDAPSWPFADILRMKLRSQFRRVLLRELAVKEGYKADDVHRIRVSLRKLNSLLECGVSVYEDEEIAQYRRGFRRMSRFLGEVRDADAFADHIKRILGTNAVPHDIRQQLQRIRQKALKELETLIVADKHQGFLEGFAAFVCSPHTAPQHAPDTAAFLLQRITLMMQTLIAPMQTPSAKLDHETLHEIRIQAKKLRYTIEAFPELLLPTAQPLVILLEKLQLRLGIIQDAATAHRILIDTHLTSHSQAKTVLTTMRAEANYQRTQLEALWRACTGPDTQEILQAIARALTHEGNHA